jgi:PAS domain S-box-containing protein
MGTWDWDIAADQTRYGGHFCELIGLPDGHAVETYDELIQYIYHADREQVRQAVAQALAEVTPSPSNWAMHPDGNLRWLAGQGQVYRDGAAKPVRLSGVIQDITERKLGEEHNALLLELAASLSEALTPQQVADVIINRALAALEGHMGIIVLTALDGGDYEIASFAGIPEEITEEALRNTLRLSHLLSDTLKTAGSLDRKHVCL